MGLTPINLRGAWQPQSTPPAATPHLTRHSASSTAGLTPPLQAATLVGTYDR